MKESVANLILALSKTVKALQMYGADHPTFRSFYTPFYRKMNDFLQSYHELNLQIERFNILNANEVVYSDEEKETSIAFRLFRDGIRSLGFVEDLTADELLRFLEMLSQSAKDQDVAVSLWEGDYDHITFYVVEEEENIAYNIPEEPVKGSDYTALIVRMIEKEKIDINEPITPDLDVNELTRLKTEIAEDERTSALPLTITTLLDYLNLEKSQDIIDSLTKLLEQCINIRDFHDAHRIVQKLQDSTKIDVIEKLETEATILSFRDVLDTPSEEAFKAFVEFIGLFSKKSMPHLLKLIGFLRRQDRLDVLRSIVAYIAKDDVALLSRFLLSSDKPTLINAIAIIGAIRSKKAVPLLQPLIQHPDTAVRTEVINAFKNIREPAMIKEFINDPDMTVRIKTLIALTQIRYEKIYPDLLQRIRSKSFLNLDFTEQKEYFNCLVANGDQYLVNDMKRILFKWILFGTKRYRIMRKLAASALAQLSTIEALEALRQGAKKANKDVRGACEMVLKTK